MEGLLNPFTFHRVHLYASIGIRSHAGTAYGHRCPGRAGLLMQRSSNFGLAYIYADICGADVLRQPLTSFNCFSSSSKSLLKSTRCASPPSLSSPPPSLPLASLVQHVSLLPPNTLANEADCSIPIALNARADQTIILPLSGDPFGSSFEFEFADEVSPDFHPTPKFATQTHSCLVFRAARRTACRRCTSPSRTRPSPL